MILCSVNVFSFSIVELHLVVMILYSANALTMSIAKLQFYDHDTAQWRQRKYLNYLDFRISSCDHNNVQRATVGRGAKGRWTKEEVVRRG